MGVKLKTRDRFLDLLKKAQEVLKTNTKYGWLLALQQIGVDHTKVENIFKNSCSKYQLLEVSQRANANFYFLKEGI